MEWFKAVERLTPYVVKIATPRGHGSGFLCFYNGTRTLCGIATAHHVVKEADEWQEPIRLVHEGSGQSFLTEKERVIWTNPANDSAVILFGASQLDLPKEPIPLVPAGRFVKVGVEVGWLGYPGVRPNNLCFFTGSISACVHDSYFLDGVAINGVSGGPVFQTIGDEIFILGTMSAYLPNVRGAGDTLPGLSFAQGVAYFHNSMERIRSLDEAREAQKAEDAADIADEAAKPTRRRRRLPAPDKAPQKSRPAKGAARKKKRR